MIVCPVAMITYDTAVVPEVRLQYATIWLHVL
jgi:hypothetical protein